MRHLPTLQQFMSEAVGAAPVAAHGATFQTSDMKSSRVMNDNPDFVGDADRGTISRSATPPEAVYVRIDHDGRIVGTCYSGERCMPVADARAMSRRSRRQYFEQTTL